LYCKYSLQCAAISPTMLFASDLTVRVISIIIIIVLLDLLLLYESCVMLQALV